MFSEVPIVSVSKMNKGAFEYFFGDGIFPKQVISSVAHMRTDQFPECLKNIEFLLIEFCQHLR